MNNAIRIQSVEDNTTSYAENLVEFNTGRVGIICSKFPSYKALLKRRKMNRILVYTTHFHSKITTCSI